MNSSSLPENSLYHLTRTRLSATVELSPTQAHVDAGVTHFLEESSRLSTFASVLAGSGASQLTRSGILALGANATGRSAALIQAIGTVGSLGAEAAAFDLINRCQISLIGPIRPINLWRWNGEGGLRQGFFSAAVNFTAFRGAGRIAQGQNIVFQHTAQSSAMVLGQNVAGAFHLIPPPHAQLAFQFFNAESMNLHLTAGLAALHTVAPGFHALERSLSLANQSRGRVLHQFLTNGRPWVFPGGHAGPPLQEATSAASSSLSSRFFSRPLDFNKTTAPLRMDSHNPESGGSVPTPLRVPRSIHSEKSDGSRRIYPFDLILDPFSHFLRSGHEAVIAVREGREIRLRMSQYEKAKRHDRYFSPGTPKLYFQISEGNTKGRAEVYLEGEALNLYFIETEKMAPGAGTIFLEWLATQAALEGKAFHITRVENRQIFHIVSRNQLVMPEQTIIEARFHDRKRGYVLKETGQLGDLNFLDQHQDRSTYLLNLRSRPHPRLRPDSHN